MVKLLSFILFVVAFIWTWNLFHSKNAVGIDVHAGIQSKLAILIEDTIKKNKPNSSNFQLVTIYTEKLDDNKMSAKFAFRYDDVLEEQEKTSQSMSGEAILTRGLSEDPQVQKWVVQSVKSNVSNIEFREGTVITSDGNEAGTAAAAGTVVEDPDGSTPGTSENPAEEKKTE